LLYYDSLSLRDVENMQMNEALSFYELAVKREAMDNLLKLNIADYPNMKDANRKKIFMSLRDIAYPVSEQSLGTTEDLQRFING